MIFSEFPAESHFPSRNCRVAVTPSRSPVRTSQPSLPHRSKPWTAGETPALQVLDAIAREQQLKGWRQSKKIALIQSRNPQWQDLAEKWGWQMAFPGESITGR
jgi:hypothetical protein